MAPVLQRRKRLSTYICSFTTSELSWRSSLQSEKHHITYHRMHLFFTLVVGSDFPLVCLLEVDKFLSPSGRGCWGVPLLDCSGGSWLDNWGGCWSDGWGVKLKIAFKGFTLESSPSLYIFNLAMFTFFFKITPLLFLTLYKPFPKLSWMMYGPKNASSSFPPFRFFWAEWSVKDPKSTRGTPYLRQIWGRGIPKSTGSPKLYDTGNISCLKHSPGSTWCATLPILHFHRLYNKNWRLTSSVLRLEIVSTFLMILKLPWKGLRALSLWTFGIVTAGQLRQFAEGGITRPLKVKLRYHELKYCCIHGGQAYRCSGKGSRRTS